MHKIKRFVPLILALFFIGAYQFGIWCDHVTGICDGTFLDKNLYTFGLIYIYALYSLPATLVILFIKSSIFRIWLKFSIPWILFSFFLVYVIPDYGGLYQPDKGDVSWFMGILFSIISIVLVLVRLFIEKRKNTKT